VTKPKMMTELSLDEEEKEVIYYIAGSIMRGFLRIADRYQNSNKWKCIMNNIKKRILTDQPVGYSNWILSVDRGGLYVTRECQDFFVGEAKIVYASEKRDGSIDYGNVIETVSNGLLKFVWAKMFDELG